MTTKAETVINEFLDWWLEPGRFPGFRSRFASGYSYKIEAGGLANEDALWLEEQKIPWKDVVVKSSDIQGEQVHVVIEGLDPVTLLRRRMAFKLVVKGQEIQSVIVREESSPSTSGV